MPVPTGTNIPRLYNLNINSTVAYTDTKVVDANGEVKLTHIPKVDSVSISNIAGLTYSSTLPVTGNQFYVKYNNEYDYIGADRKVKLHVSHAGKTIIVNYIVVASPVDADVINPIITFINNFTSNVYTADDLANPGHSTIAWGNIVDHPVEATINVDGLLSHLDKQKLDRYNPDIKHIAKIKIDSASLTPNSFEEIELVSSPSIRPSLTREGKLQFDVIGSTSTTTASIDTSGFVSNTDPRLTDARTPKTHSHAIMDVTGLSLALAAKSGVDHKHQWSEIQGSPPSAISMGLVSDTDYRLSNARVPTAHSHTASNITDLATTLNGKANFVHDHYLADIVDIANLSDGTGIPTVSPADIFEGNFIAHGLIVGADSGLSGHIWQGAAYVYNRRVAFDDTVFFRALGPRIPVSANSTDSTAYPLIRGVYSSTATDFSYQIRVVTPNTTPGSFTGLTTEWKRSDSLVWTPISTPSSNIIMENGLTVRMNMESTTQYNAGDLWSATVSPGQTLYIDLESNGEIAFNFTLASAPEPLVRNTAMRIAKVTASATAITNVENRTIVKKLRGTVRATTPASDSNSDEIATTSFVMSKVNGTPSTPTTTPTTTESEVRLTADQTILQVPAGVSGFRYQDIKGYKFRAMIYNPLTVAVAYNLRINGLNTTADYKAPNSMPSVPGGGYMTISGYTEGFMGGPAIASVQYAISNGTSGIFSVCTSAATARLESVGFSGSEANSIGQNSYIRGIQET